MTPADTMPLDEAQIALLFEEAGLHEAPALDMDRVGRVMQRAVHETVISDTTSFVFKGFPAVLSSFMSVAAGEVPQTSTDYRV